MHYINLYQNVNFMKRIKMGNIPVVFHEATKKLNHKYPSAFSNLHRNIEKCS